MCHSTPDCHYSSHISLHILYIWLPICAPRIFYCRGWELNVRPYIILCLILKIILQKSFWACNCNITLFATHPDTTLTGTSQVYTYRQHTATDWNEPRQACWHVVIAQGTGIDPWWWSEDWPKNVGLFKFNFKYASQTFLTCVVLNVNCESVFN